nr:subtilisin-like protease SBT4.3 [Tanacetum cinerariifolium]
HYVVLLGSLPEGDYSPSVHHFNIIKEIVDPRSSRDRISVSLSEALSTDDKNHQASRMMDLVPFLRNGRENVKVALASLATRDYSPSVHHFNIIKEIVDPSFAEKSLQRNFGRSFNGFAAYVTEAEVQKLKRVPGIESVFLCRKLYPQTTRSMDYIQLSDGIARNPSVASDITIGVIDSGIWPESPSFKDDGFGSIPAKWKGECKGGAGFPCNKKIIGARYYSIDDLSSISARDRTGHRTHVASIVAGNYVKGASYFGIADGVAKGGIPSARLAVYKVCDAVCHTTDLLSAFDGAIADGVDVLSVSMALGTALGFTIDPIVIGSLHV